MKCGVEAQVSKTLDNYLVVNIEGIRYTSRKGQDLRSFANEIKLPKGIDLQCTLDDRLFLIGTFSGKYKYQMTYGL